MNLDKLHFETLAIHAGQEVDASTGAVISPIILATTFERNEEGGYPQGHQYSRRSNPNRFQLEICVAALEGGKAAAAFASGMAGISAIFQALQPGDHIIASDDIYHGTTYILRNHFLRWGLQVDWVDMTNFELVKKTIKSSTKLFWVETPSNPLLQVYDLTELSKLVHSVGAQLVVDNTFATPVLQRVFDLGVDLSFHSTTKYLNGHSDVLGGIVVAKEKTDFFTKIQGIQQSYGAVPSPFDCYLTLRGIKTLAYRMKGHCANALSIAQFLEKHSAVEKVFYPGLKSHPQYELAKKQMPNGFGGIISFTIKEGEQVARKICNSIQLFIQATSLGGVESLIEHRASVENPDTKTPKNLIRLSVGLEHVDDLIQDLDQALNKK